MPRAPCYGTRPRPSGRAAVRRTRASSAFILAEAPHRKQIAKMASTFIQNLLLAVYRLPFINALLRTRVGSAFYVVCYDIYKSHLEAAGSQALANHIAAGTWAIDVG